MNFPQVGQILPNGHTVDAAYCVGDARYVLAHRDGKHKQFAVWSVDQDGDTVNGHYFGDPVAAQQMFAECCFDWWPEAEASKARPTDENLDYLREAAERAVLKNFLVSESNRKQPILETMLGEISQILQILQTMLLKHGIPEAVSIDDPGFEESKNAFRERKKKEISAIREHLNQYL